MPFAKKEIHPQKYQKPSRKTRKTILSTVFLLLCALCIHSFTVFALISEHIFNYDNRIQSGSYVADVSIKLDAAGEAVEVPINTVEEKMDSNKNKYKVYTFEVKPDDTFKIKIENKGTSDNNNLPFKYFLALVYNEEIIKINFNKPIPNGYVNLELNDFDEYTATVTDNEGEIKIYVWDFFSTYESPLPVIPSTMGRSMVTSSQPESSSLPIQSESSSNPPVQSEEPSKAPVQSEAASNPPVQSEEPSKAPVQSEAASKPPAQSETASKPSAQSEP